MHLRGAGITLFASTLVLLAACSDDPNDTSLLEPAPVDPTTSQETDAGSAASSDAAPVTDGGAPTTPADAAPADTGPPPTVYSGKATYYYANGTGACGTALTDSMLVAALNAAQYSRANCGRCAAVRGPLGSVTVKIQDRCPGCAYGDLDLSSTAFKQIAKLADGRVNITWSFVPCP